MIDVDQVLDRLKKMLDIKSDTDLAKRLGRASSNVAVWRKRRSIDYGSVLEFAIKNNIDLNYLFKAEKIGNATVNRDLKEEFIFFNLKRTLFRDSLLKKFDANMHFLFKVIREKKEDIHYAKENAKEILIDLVRNHEINTILDSDSKKENVIRLIEEEMSHLDCYVFLKYFDKFVSD